MKGGCYDAVVRYVLPKPVKQSKCTTKLRGWNGKVFDAVYTIWRGWGHRQSSEFKCVKTCIKCCQFSWFFWCTHLKETWTNINSWNKIMYCLTKWLSELLYIRYVVRKIKCLGVKISKIKTKPVWGKVSLLTLVHMRSIGFALSNQKNRASNRETVSLTG